MLHSGAPLIIIMFTLNYYAVNTHSRLCKCLTSIIIIIVIIIVIVIVIIIIIIIIILIIIVIIIIIIITKYMYSQLTTSYHFVPVAFKTMGPINSSGMELIKELGRRITLITGDAKETSYLFQHLSVAIQRFNAFPFVVRSCSRTSSKDNRS